MPHILEQYTENHGNVVDNEQQVPISERTPKEVIYLNIFRGGEQTSQSGMTRHFKEGDLDQVVDSYNPLSHLAPLIRGHDEKDDGAPSSGWVKKVERKGLDLFAHVALTGFGQQNLEEGNFKKVSCRFYPPDDPANPVPGKLGLRHLALVTIPAVKGLHEFSEGDAYGGIDSGSEWDFTFSEDLSYSYADENLEKKEVKKSIVDSMQKFMLDGEDQQPSPEDEELQAMELAEDIEDGKRGEPVTFKPKIIGMTKSQYDLDGEDIVTGGEDVILEDTKFGEAPCENKEETVHDADAKRQKEYKEIIDNNTKVFNEGMDSPMGKIGELVEQLLKHFSTGRAKQESEPVVLNADPCEPDNESDSIDVVDAPSMMGYTPLDGDISIEITAVDEDPEFADKERCWEGYEPTPGKKPYEDGSCQKETDHGENIEDPMDTPYTREQEEEIIENEKEVKKVELIVPEKRKTKGKKIETSSYSESSTETMSELEKHKLKVKWSDFAESYYKKGVITESIIPMEELAESLIFLETHTNSLSFSEGQVNPLKTMTKLLDRMPTIVGLNGFEPGVKESAENLFKDNLPESGSDGLVYSENNVAFDSGSITLHQQALDYSEKNGIDYYSAIQKIIG